MSEGTSSGSSGGGCGCLSIIVFFLLMWALIFGVTFEGKHYAIGCGCDEGVSVGRAP
jgi:hypothetical protein